MDELHLRADELAWRQIDEEIVAVDVANSAYLASNPAGTLLWNLLANGSTRERLAAALVDAYGIEAERARTDVEAFLADLSRRGLLAG